MILTIEIEFILKNFSIQISLIYLEFHNQSLQAFILFLKRKLWNKIQK